MAEEASPARTASKRPLLRHWKRRELPAADGGRLVLRTDGTIELLAADGTVAHSWGLDDVEWGTYAFRFGIRAQARTMAPRGPDTGSAKPGF